MADIAAVAPPTSATPAPVAAPASTAGGHDGTAPAAPTGTQPPVVADGAGPRVPQPAPLPGQSAPNPSSSGQPPPPTQSATPVTVSESAIDLRSLPTPTALAARVVSTDGAGRINLETALGRVVVTTPTPAPQPGTTLRLLVDEGGSVRLQQAPAQPSPPNLPGTGPQTSERTIQTLTVGDLVRARLVSPSPATPTNGPPSVPANGGAPITVRVVAVTTAGNTATPAPIAPSGNPAPTVPARPAIPGLLPATVAGRAPLGQPILVTANATLILEQGTLPNGARVMLEVLSASRGAPGVATSIAPLTGAIEESLAALGAIAPALAAATDTSRIARFGPRLTSAALFLMSALQGGGARAWLGQDVQATLQRENRIGLLKRIAEALSRRAPRLETETASATGEVWRSVYLPVSTVGGWLPLRVAWRDPDEQTDRSGDEDPGARFQVDFDFSRLGPIRLDGLTSQGRLDLLVVSRSPLPTDAIAGIQDLFAATLDVMGHQGHIRFVAQPELKPMEARDASGRTRVTA